MPSVPPVPHTLPTTEPTFQTLLFLTNVYPCQPAAHTLHITCPCQPPSQFTVHTPQTIFSSLHPEPLQTSYTHPALNYASPCHTLIQLSTPLLLLSYIHPCQPAAHTIAYPPFTLASHPAKRTLLDPHPGIHQPLPATEIPNHTLLHIYYTYSYSYHPATCFLSTPTPHPVAHPLRMIPNTLPCLLPYTITPPQQPPPYT